MPFRRASELLEARCGVQVSEERARRQTEKAGAAYEQVQTQEAKRLQRPEEEVAVEKFAPAERQVVSSDGAFVQLQNTVWIEVKTLVIAQQQRDAQQRLHTLKLSYFSRQLHQLKHAGPSQVLKTLQALRRRHPELEKVQENVAYLEKREAQMQYPRYQQQEWPIGSGMVESAHKQVVQMRLKGAGMRW